MEKRKCVKCGADLAEDDVMKILFEDGLSEILPLTTCPACFGKQIRERTLR